MYQQKGHVELIGPNRAGAAQGNLIRLAPPAVQTQSGVLSIGATTSSQTLGNGLALRQQLGTHEIGARLTFPHDGVLRYEITDWGGRQSGRHGPGHRFAGRRTCVWLW